MSGPLLTAGTAGQLNAGRRSGALTVECSLDLQFSRATVDIGEDCWSWQGRRFPYLDRCNDRTVYRWNDHAFEPVSRFSGSLIKLVPTRWGPPTFEIDGIKMLPTSQMSPYEDAQRKVGLIQPRGKAILDACGGLGYFAAWCLHGRAASILSFEINPDVLWLRGVNPWSPAPGERLTVVHADVAAAIIDLPDGSVDAVLHDPPRFGIAGELYSRRFYDQLARVLRRKGRLFHYTGSPNKVSGGRDLAGEVSRRLRHAGFAVERVGDGILGVKA